jgi:hypothetical protein
MDYLLTLGLGFVGSLHCAAMCGPLLLALPGSGDGAGRFIAGRIFYHLGRVLTYALLGVLAGLVGKSFVLAGLQRWLSIVLGVLILLGFLAAKRTALSKPAVRLVMWLKSAMAAQLQRRNFSSLGLLGMLNGLLPCGLVYVALAGAVARGTLLAGILYMLVFGLGTWPMLLAIGFSGKMFPAALRLKLRGAIPFGVILLAALLILRGLGLGIPYVSPDLTASVPGCCAP